MTEPMMQALAASRRRGFTLVELLVGATVMAGILAASYMCLQAGYDTRKTVAFQTETLQSARVAMALIAADLRQACPLSEEFEFIGIDRDIAGREADNLDFASHNWDPQLPGESDFCEISYYVDRNPRTGTLSLWRRRDPTPDDRPLEGGFRHEIASNVRSLELEYYDGYFWHASWGQQRRRRVEETETGRYSQTVRLPRRAVDRLSRKYSGTARSRKRFKGRLSRDGA